MIGVITRKSILVKNFLKLPAEIKEDLSRVRGYQVYPQYQYVGRYNSRHGLLKSSPLANPFKLKNGIRRERVIEQYSHWLNDKILRSDPVVTKELERLKGIYRERGELHLVCWCSPLVCHGDIVKHYLEMK